MNRLFFCLLLFSFSLSVSAQIKDQELADLTVTSKKLDVRQIIDSINKNAPANYAEPEAIGGIYTSTYNRGSDTVFGLLLPAYLLKTAKGIYGELLRDSTFEAVVADKRRTKAHYDRTAIITNNPFPAKNSTLLLIKKLYEIEDTDHILYGREGTDEDPYFYILFRPKKKIRFPLFMRPFVSSIDKDSLFSYRLLKIRRKNWALISQESALLIGSPATVKEIIKTTSFSRARALIDSAKAQTTLRRYIQQEAWQLREDEKYHFQSSLQSDNLLNISLALFKKFPDPGGYVGTATFTADPQLPLPAKEVLKPYTIGDWSKERSQYSGKE